MIKRLILLGLLFCTPAHAIMTCDGSDDYAKNTTSATNYNFGTGPWSVVFFYKESASQSDTFVFEIGDSASTGIRYNTDDGVGRPNIRVSSTNYVFSSFNATTDQWYMVSITRGDGGASNFKLFINTDQIDSTKSNSDSVTCTLQPITFCNDKDVSGARTFNGELGDFYVFDFAMTQTQIQMFYTAKMKYAHTMLPITNPDSLRAYFPLDDFGNTKLSMSGSNTILDRSKYRNHSTPTNGPGTRPERFNYL